jgi:hypothetical protein
MVWRKVDVSWHMGLFMVFRIVADFRLDNQLKIT